MESLNNLVKKMKPVTFMRGDYGYTRDNTLQQQILLKAMEVSADPEYWMKAAKIKTTAELYRTLDKMAMRREYHEVLVRNGLDLEFLVGKLKNLCGSSNEKIQMDGVKTLLKSLGLDEYRETEQRGDKTWEEMVNAAAELERAGKELPTVGKYEVKVPEIPEAERKKREEEMILGKELYEE